MMNRRTSILSILASAALLAVAGCAAQPLLAPDVKSSAPQMSKPVTANRVNFEHAESRLDMVVRDAVLFRLNGAGASSAPDPDFIATIEADSRTSGRFRTQNTSAGQTSAATVTVTAKLTLREPETNDRIKVIRRSAVAPFDKNGQDFANERAQLDAENRAAKDVAEQFATMIAVELTRLR